jgi:SnoaL-like domain
MAMPTDPDTQDALHVALSYFRAWTEPDFEQAMSYIADDIVCDAPAGRIEGADLFRAFMGPFSQIVANSELVAAFGDDDSALTMYGTDTVPVQNAPGAEYVTVRDGRIRYMRIIFDRAPFEAARRSSG